MTDAVTGEDSLVADMAVMRDHFDSDFYCRRYPDVVAGPLPPLEHFSRHGWREGRDPTEGFTTTPYLDANDDVRDAGVNPFVHYLTTGQYEERSPQPAIEAAQEKIRLEEVRQEEIRQEEVRQRALDTKKKILSTAFDADFYRQTNPDLAADIDPLEHYLEHGWREGRDPSAEFSTDAYIAANSDVKDANLNPFLHFLMTGQQEGRSPHPKVSDDPEEQVRQRELDAARAVMAQAFDPAFYRRNTPGLAAEDDPIEHYVLRGWRAGRDPSADFSTAAYLAAYGDVSASDTNPFHHYLVTGREEGRSPRPGSVTTPEEQDQRRRLDAARTVIGGAFDTAFYRESNPDLASDVDSLDHYLTVGWQEGRDPCSWFSVKGYLRVNDDVRDGEVEPFGHYLTVGQREERNPNPSVRARTLDPTPGAEVPLNDSFLDLIRHRPQALAPENQTFDPASLSLHWVIPDFARGLGGHMTIFRMIRWLEFFGHRCTIWITHRIVHQTEQEAADTILAHFQTIRAPVYFMDDRFADMKGDAIVATGWDTVAPVMSASGIKERYYFVQDYEPDFYARGAKSLAAAATYDADIACICASPWLQQRLTERHGRWARAFSLAYNHETYHPGTASRPPAGTDADMPCRIALYSRINTERRAVELALLALQILAARGVPFHVDFFGGELDLDTVPFSATLHGVLGTEELARLYRDADIGLCFSSTNYSLVPQEMMACGLPVLELDGDSTRAVFPDDVVTFAGPAPHDIADRLQSLLESPDRRAAQRDAALKWVAQFSWETSARTVEAAIVERLVEKGLDAVDPEPAKRPAPVKTSVFIPTLNGGALFRDVIDAVRAQRTPWPFDIIVIDSGSTDGTAEFCEAADDIVFARIRQSEFSHGGTRNKGVEMAGGDFIAFLTQDAKPVDDFWLYNLVTSLERHDNAAGAFGRHEARDDASPFTARDIDAHFATFLEQPLKVSRETDPARYEARDPEWLQFLHFYSDNNSCLRRRVWDQIAYPAIPYGEDQAWAMAIIDAGFEKVYVPSATVWHSHDYDVDDMQTRAATEAAFFRDLFGYVLMPDEAALKAALDLENQRDAAWADEHDIGSQMLAKRHALNEARFRGWLAGSGE